MDDIKLDFREFLEGRAVLQSGRKSDRTSERLKLAAARCLSATGYRDLKVTDITDEAGTSSGTFYIYFKNKTEISQVVIEEFIAHLSDVISGDTGGATAYGALRSSNTRWLNYIRENAGMLRSMFQIADESPEISKIIHQLNKGWYERVAKNVIRRFPEADKPDGGIILLTVYSLGSMMDEIARRLVIYPDENFISLVGEKTASDESFADFLSMLWFRALYGRAPEEELEGPPLELSRLLLPY